MRVQWPCEYCGMVNTTPIMSLGDLDAAVCSHCGKSYRYRSHRSSGCVLTQKDVDDLLHSLLGGIPLDDMVQEACSKIDVDDVLHQVEVDEPTDGFVAEEPEKPKMTYRKACLIFGNGDFHRGQQNIFMLARRLEEAREKHPHFAEGVYQGLGVVGAEYREFVRAVEHESSDRQLDEALDVACTAMRFVNREYKTRRAKVVRKGKKQR